MENLEKIKLLALSPLDGRYFGIREMLSPYFSEYALIKNRVKVEVYWLVFLLENISEIKDKYQINIEKINLIKDIYNKFNEDSALKVKEIESITKHDVKACEIFVANKLKEIDLEKLVSLVHLGCTSEDITNCAYANMLKKGLQNIWIKKAEEVVFTLKKLAKDNEKIPMLAHTHGQPATPTTISKEFLVYINRLSIRLEKLKVAKYYAKFNGATGNYAAINIAFPNEDWESLSKKFIEQYLELDFNEITTQIEGSDYIVEIFDTIKHFNNIISDLDVDIWLYVSKKYIKQRTIKTEVGSSTMPHKVNPINFENSEGNIEISNALLVAMSNKLAKSRLQRDLSGSTVLRNIGIAIAYSVQALEQTIVGLNKIDINVEQISIELENNYSVLAEAIQTILRKYSVPNAYDMLKELTRGKEITKEHINEFVSGLQILSEEDKKMLLKLKPNEYIGIAEILVDKYL